MVHKDTVVNNMVDFINSKMNALSNDSQLFHVLIRPSLSRVINNNLNKVNKFLDLISDADGMIDVEGILNDTIDILLISPVKEENGIKFGNGCVEINIPFINKAVSFDKRDIEEFKQGLKQLKENKNE
jgi:hypothetical protein